MKYFFFFYRFSVVELHERSIRSTVCVRAYKLFNSNDYLNFKKNDRSSYQSGLMFSLQI